MLLDSDRNDMTSSLDVAPSRGNATSERRNNFDAFRQLGGSTYDTDLHNNRRQTENGGFALPGQG